jgi:hypothetical protein
MFSQKLFYVEKLFVGKTFEFGKKLFYVEGLFVGKILSSWAKTFCPDIRRYIRELLGLEFSKSKSMYHLADYSFITCITFRMQN